MSDTEDRLRDRIVHLEERAQMAELKAERFEAALNKEVMAVIEKCHKAAVGNPKMLVSTAIPVEYVERLSEENAVLKSACDEIAAAFLALPKPHNRVIRVAEGIESLVAENALLKAEVERLRASSFVTAVPVEQYERVIKAGDAMYEELGNLAMSWQVRDAWKDAKEGGQP